MYRKYALMSAILSFFSSCASAYDKYDIQLCESYVGEAEIIGCYKVIDPHICQSGSTTSRLRCYRDLTAQRAKEIKSESTLEYSIIKDESKRDIKRVVEVLLNNKIPKERLELIAHSIKDSETIPYRRTFIGYYLSGQDIGYWATTNFNPDLEVKMLGLSIEDEKNY